MKSIYPFYPIAGAALFSVSALGQTPSTNNVMLPVRLVTLFSSGVSYTERRGSVNGDAAVPLTFRTSQINDILKSLVLIDTGGVVQPAVYATKDPIDHTLQSYAVDVNGNTNQAAILGSLKGSSVSIQTHGKPDVVGQILGVEERQVTGADGKPVTEPILSLFTDSGIVAISLNTDRSVRLLDPKLEKELHDALSVLGSNTENGRRKITLKFSGNGKREVRVGYISESSIWKVSYRLLIGDDAPKLQGKAYLQGWAIVENTTDEDWKNVRLSLVSGRPVSFIQDLYQPLYIARPVVGPDVVASLSPQTFDDSIQNPAAALLPAGVKPGDIIALPNDNSIIFHEPVDGKTRFSVGNLSQGVGGASGGRRSGPTVDELGYTESLIRNSVASAASGEKAGEQFAYNIKAPITLPRQQAAMIPVITHDVEATRISIFNADSGSRFPLSALRIHNTTGEQLKAGPVTLFDHGVYAGDAKVEDIPIDRTRLVSYAVDLKVQCERQSPATSISETSIYINRGVLIFERRQRIATTYTIRSRADKSRTVVIEHPFDSSCSLVTPARADERTATLYRFNVTAAPGKSVTFRVVTDQPLVEKYGILDSETGVLTSYTNRTDISQPIRQALTEVIARETEIQRLKNLEGERSGSIDAINADQDRIRKDMAALDRTSLLYKRYVDELDKQETQIHNLTAEVTMLKGQADARGQELKRFVDGLHLK